jgi:hypothetical protein
MQLARTVSSSAFAALLLLGLSGCSHETELEPAKGANELDGNIAWVGVQGVQILAKGDDWEGDKDVLKRATPVYLVINNRGVRPIKVQYSKIVLVNPGGQDHAALYSPTAFPGTETGVSTLAEGVIQPGQNASGYVYFEPVPEGVARVTLDVELIDARSGDRFAIAKIPFETD